MSGIRGFGPHKVQIDPTTHLEIGKRVEVTAWERQRLEEIAYELRRIAHHAREGWLLEYFEGVKRIRGIMHDIVSRSHHSS